MAGVSARVLTLSFPLIPCVNKRRRPIDSVLSIHLGQLNFKHTWPKELNGRLEWREMWSELREKITRSASPGRGSLQFTFLSVIKRRNKKIIISATQKKK